MANKNEVDKLAYECQQAKAAGLSYGQWKALQPRKEANPEELPDGWLRCEYCGQPFKQRYRKRFCDLTCRERAYEARAKVMRADYQRRCRERKEADG